MRFHTKGGFSMDIRGIIALIVVALVYALYHETCRRKAAPICFYCFKCGKPHYEPYDWIEVEGNDVPFCCAEHLKQWLKEKGKNLEHYV